MISETEGDKNEGQGIKDQVKKQLNAKKLMDDNKRLRELLK